MNIVIQEIEKRFASFQALNGASLDIASGELIALLGPSGSGKTTLLRIIAGLEFPDSGRILFGGKDMASRPVRERNVGFVFQHYALFKHMTVRDNVSFGVRIRPRKVRPEVAVIRKQADELLELVQLGGLGDRYPHQLSGGQRQRVALARALAIEPKILLLDEPFGALDAKVRKDLRRWLRELHQRIGTTTVFVTHDQEEALELADRVVIMNRGRIEQVGTVDEVYERPASPFVFEFLGDTNILPAYVQEGVVRLAGCDASVDATAGKSDGPARIYVRPSDMRLTNEPVQGIPVVISSVQRTGPIVRAEARVAGSDIPLTVELPHLHYDTPQFTAGASLRVRMMQYSVFSGQDRRRGPTLGGDAIGVAATRRRRRDDVIEQDVAGVA